MISGTTRLFGIIGNPVEHSLSPIMHNAAFAAMGLNAVYLPMQPQDPAEGYRGLRALGFVGVSVTVPFKVAIMPLLDHIDPVATKIGAVNTLLFHTDAQGATLCTGSNTDWIGANRALETEIDLHGSTVLILGAGGAARAVGFGLVEAGATILVHNRTESKGRQLAAQLGATYFTASELAAVQADVLINTTSVGMSPHHQSLPIDPKLLPHFSVVMDIVYAPLETALLRAAAACGCRTVDGIQMLLHQGAAQCNLWTGHEAPLAVMRHALLTELSSRGTAPATGI
jgi:shikimate dehydrogenase